MRIGSSAPSAAFLARRYDWCNMHQVFGKAVVVSLASQRRISRGRYKADIFVNMPPAVKADITHLFNVGEYFG